MKFNFSNIKKISLPDLGRPIFYRINHQSDLSTPIDDIYWGSAIESNRFSIDGITQTYLATNLDAISEATPWGKMLEDSPNQHMRLITHEMLEKYSVSLIQPAFSLNLLNFTEELSRYGNGVTNDIANGKDKSTSKIFSQQCLEETSVDGIFYSSSRNTLGQNIYLYDRCKIKFNDSSIIKRIPLIQVIKPIKEHLENSLGLEFLIG